MRRPARSAPMLLAALAASLLMGPAAPADVVTFEDLTSFPIDPLTGREQDFFNGPTANAVTVPGPYGPVSEGAFRSGGIDFINRVDQTYGSWSGFSYSRVYDTVNGFPNQWGAITGTGRGGSVNYGVAFGYDDLTPNLFDPDPFDPTSLADLEGLPYFTLPDGAAIEGIYVTNTTYAYVSMTQGDPFAGTPFGGSGGADPDFLLLTAYGSDAAGNILPTSVEFYLGDYRSDDPAGDYILTDWAFMDLSALGGAERIYFNISGSKTGDFGLNTPAYFAVDDIRLASAAVPEPSGLALLGVGASGIGLLLRRRGRVA